ncbi:MAG: hypothetical protein RLZZ303_1598 [Candidatus Hydrogenedentota bacterium]
MSEFMLQFRCPHCQQVLRIAPKFLGQTGKCNKCAGRIALVGHENPDVVQMASLVDDGMAARDQRPATDAQRDLMRRMGAPEDAVVNALRHDVSTIIQVARNDLKTSEAPSQSQMELLKRLGVTDEERALVRTRAEASKLIEGLQPKPTEAQLAYLKRLGASPEQMAGVVTRSQAGELIEQLLRGG